MSSSIPIIQSLTSIANSANYCQPIRLNTKMEQFDGFKCDYESISNNIQIIPPSMWFSIEELKCFATIRNDIERSRVTREGLLSTNLKGNLLNKITYQGYDEDIGTIQQTEQSFCVAFAVVKDSCQQFIKQIGSQLRACLVKKSSLIDRSHLKISQLDDISKQIYSKYRVFLIFDTRSQPGRVVSFHSCFYPNVRFTLEKIKKKDGVKFSPNEVLQQIQRGEILNTFGLLSLDSKMRLLMVKKDDPELSRDSLVGVWVITSYHSNRTKKQFAKEDAIWAALLDFYTNPDVKIKLSIMAKQRGFLCYFGFKKQRSKLDSPEFYLFEPNTKHPPKWSFAIKNEVLSQSNKSCEIKIQFMNSTIVEERQYSQFSDQTNNYEDRLKNENVNRENITVIKQQRSSKNYQLQESGSSQSKSTDNPYKSVKVEQEQDKNRIIKQLREQLQKYKQRCIELQAVNKMLLQQKMMNPVLYQPQYPIMGQIPPVYHQYNQMQNYPYPLSYSQVSSTNYPVMYQQNLRNETFKINNPQPQQNNNKDVNLSYNPKTVPFRSDDLQNTEKPKKPTYSFPQAKQDQITFGTQNNNQIQSKAKLFVKKSQSYDPGVKKQQNKQKLREDEEQKVINENLKQINLKKDMRNISFQDSFAQYHSDGEEEGPTFKNGEPKFSHYLSKDLQKSAQQTDYFTSNRKPKCNEEESDENYNAIKSPQFKRLYSLQTEPIVNTVQYEVNINSKQMKKQQAGTKGFNQFNQRTKISQKQEQLPRQKQQPKIVENSKINLNLKKSPQKVSPVVQRKTKKLESSSDSQQKQRHKIKQNSPKLKQTQKQEKIKKPSKVISDSDDSDEEMKSMRKMYLNKKF